MSVRVREADCEVLDKGVFYQHLILKTGGKEVK